MGKVPRAIASTVGTTVLAVTLVACSGSSKPTQPPPSPTAPKGGQGPAATPGIDPDTALAARLAKVTGPDLTPARHGQFGMNQAEILPIASAADSLPASDAADSAVRRDAYLRVHYPAGSASQTVQRESGAPSGGAQAYLYYSRRPVDALVLHYYVRFPVGFDFVKGGKLPGLFGGTVTSGQHIPDGSNGFSTRLMWRAGGAGELYAYLPDSVTHGTSIGRGQWTFATGRWTEVQQEVRLNHPGQRDGHVAIWINGKPVLDAAGLRFRTVSDLAIGGVFFSTFFGGDDPSWATPVDQYVDFAGISVRPPSDR